MVESRKEVDEAKELVGICKEYVIGLLCEIKRKEMREEDAARAAELAAYFTHCALQVGGGGRGSATRAAGVPIRGPACAHVFVMPAASMPHLGAPCPINSACAPLTKLPSLHPPPTPPQPVHLALSLRSAMAIFFKLRNFATAATFARRLLELNPGAKMAQAARQVLTACEKTPVDEVSARPGWR